MVYLSIIAVAGHSGRGFKSFLLRGCSEENSKISGELPNSWNTALPRLYPQGWGYLLQDFNFTLGASTSIC